MRLLGNDGTRVNICIKHVPNWMGSRHAGRAAGFAIRAVVGDEKWDPQGLVSRCFSVVVGIGELATFHHFNIKHMLIPGDIPKLALAE